MLAVLFVASGWIVLGRSPFDRFWLWPGLLALLVLGVVLVRDGLWPAVIAGPISGTSSLAGVALGALAWAQVLGLPRPLACALGIGLTSRPLRFSNHLVDLNKPFGEALQRAQEDTEDRAAALRAARTQVVRMARLRAPDAAWGQLRDDVLAEYRGWIELLEAAAPVERQVEAEAASERVFARWRAMHEQAADAQRLLATPARRRRGAALWLATAGLSCLAMGAARANAAAAIANPFLDAQTRSAVILVGFGLVALVGAGVRVLRR